MNGMLRVVLVIAVLANSPLIASAESPETGISTQSLVAMRGFAEEAGRSLEQAEFPRALQSDEKALAEARRLGQFKDAALYGLRIGQIHAELAEHQSALEHYDAALEDLKKGGDAELQNSIHLARADSLLALKKIDEAESALSAISAIDSESRDRLSREIASLGFEQLLVAGRELEKQGKSEEAVQTWMRGLTAADQAGALRFQLDFEFAVGWSEYKRKNYRIALSHFGNILKILASKDGESFPRELHASRGRVLSLIGHAKSGSGDHSGAVESFSAAAEALRSAGEDVESSLAAKNAELARAFEVGSDKPANDTAVPGRDPTDSTFLKSRRRIPKYYLTHFLSLKAPTPQGALDGAREIIARFGGRTLDCGETNDNLPQFQYNFHQEREWEQAQGLRLCGEVETPRLAELLVSLQSLGEVRGHVEGPRKVLKNPPDFAAIPAKVINLEDELLVLERSEGDTRAIQLLGQLEIQELKAAWERHRKAEQLSALRLSFSP